MKRKKIKAADLTTRIVGGAVGGALAQLLAVKVMSDFSDEIKNIVLVAGGAVLPEVASVKGLSEVGSGVIAVGAANLTQKYIIEKKPAATAGTPFSRFNNAIGSGVDPFYQRMINPASDMAITGRRAKKKENQVVL